MPCGWGVGVDYIVFGTGYGATLLVLGWVIRTFGPGMRYQDAEDDTPASADVLVYRVSWTRFAQALGAVIATDGGAIIIVTFITALINPGDHVGSIVLWVCFALVVLGTAVWTWLYVARYGANGLVPYQVDIARLLPSRERPFSQQIPRPASSLATEPALGNPVAPSDDVAEMIVEEDANEDDDAPDVDIGADEEMAVHASRFQIHHPDEVPEDAYQDLFAVYGVEPEADEPLESEPTQPEPQPDEEQHPSPEPGDSEEDDGSIDVPDEEIVADVPATEEASVDEISVDEENVDPDMPLPDTPEGRAEALRRIQAWQPDEDA